MRTDPKPADAWWDDTEAEWVHGARDGDGRLVGEVRYWDKAGTLISTAEHVAGKPHGLARRYYPNGDLWQECRYVDGEIDGERLFVRPLGDVPLSPELRGVAADVAAYVCLYEHGDLIGCTWRHADGREVDQSGRPIPPRPTGVEPTASPMQGGWIFMRRRGTGPDRVKLSREYYGDGTLKEESRYDDGSERAYYKTGQLAHEGTRNRTGDRHYQLGAWRHYDARGILRYVSEYEAGTEVRRTWHRAEGARSGPITSDQETGVWTAGDDEFDLGPPMTDAALLAHAVTADMLDEIAYADRDRSIVAMVARARRAGIAQDLAELGLSDGPAWLDLDDDTGELVTFYSKPYYPHRIVTLVHALRWGSPDGEILAELATALLRADRAQAALDVVGAALLVEDRPAWTLVRVACLRALGRIADAGRLEVRGLDDRALELLAEIRANPADDAPRLVFADHIAAKFPEHTAVIVAQCSGRSQPRLERALLATLPEWLRSEYLALSRGFFEDVRYIEAEAFVGGDPDVLYRMAPTSTALELQYASGEIARLVTMPALRRYTSLGFTDTYLQQVQTEQLARCTYLEQLAALGLYNTSLGDDDLAPILRATAWPRLAGLDLGNSRDEQDYTLAGLAPIVDAPFVATLSSLNVSGRWMGVEVGTTLAQLPALDDLDVSRNRIGDAGVTALAASPRWRRLVLDTNDLGPAAATVLATFGGLEMLSLENNAIGDAGVLALAPVIPRLTWLDLAGTGLGDVGARALCDADTHPELRLTIGRSQIGEAMQQRLRERFGTRVALP